MLHYNIHGDTVQKFHLNFSNWLPRNQPTNIRFFLHLKWENFSSIYFGEYFSVNMRKLQLMLQSFLYPSMQLTRIYTKIVRSHSNVNEKQRTKWSKSQNKRRKKNEVKNNGWERERERGTKIAIIIVMNEEKRNWGLCPIVFNVVVIFVVDTRFPLVFLAPHLSRIPTPRFAFDNRILFALVTFACRVYVISFQFLCVATLYILSYI